MYYTGKAVCKPKIITNIDFPRAIYKNVCPRRGDTAHMWMDIGVTPRANICVLAITNSPYILRDLFSFEIDVKVNAVILNKDIKCYVTFIKKIHQRLIYEYIHPARDASRPIRNLKFGIFNHD